MRPNLLQKRSIILLLLVIAISVGFFCGYTYCSGRKAGETVVVQPMLTYVFIEHDTHAIETYQIGGSVYFDLEDIQGFTIRADNDGIVFSGEKQNSPQYFYFINKWTDLFDNIGDAIPSGETAPRVVEIIERHENWIKVATVLGDRWVELNSIRQTVRLDVPSFDQMELGYTYGCEMVSLAMLMGLPDEESVHALVAARPINDDPYIGMRGNLATSGWTVFPPALRDLMETHLGSFHDMSGCEIADLKEKLNTGTPIMVWVVGLGWPVHALCLTGYDNDGFFYNDPGTGEKDVPIGYEEFYSIWNKSIHDNLLNVSYAPRKAMSYYTEPIVMYDCIQ